MNTSTVALPAAHSGSQSVVRATLPATQPLNQQEWRDISTIISKRWPYWFATPPSSRESAVAILASHLYSDFNGINPDSGYQVNDQNIEFWLTVTDRKASQLILKVAINALFNLQPKDNLEQQLAKVERSIQLLHHKVAPRHPDYYRAAAARSCHVRPDSD